MLLVVHLNGEHLTDARVGGGVGGQEDHLITLHQGTLLQTGGHNALNTLDAGDDLADRATESTLGVTRGQTDHVVQGVQQAADLDLVGTAGDLDVNTLPPWHLLRDLQDVLTVETSHGDDGDLLLDLILLPTFLEQNTLDLGGNFDVTLLTILNIVHSAVHLVDTNNQLPDTQQVQQTGVVTGLSGNFTGLVVTLRDGGNETATISRAEEQGNIGLGGTSDHVLDEVPVPRGIDDGVVVAVGVELLGVAGDGDTTLLLGLLVVHVVGEREGGLTVFLGLLLQLLHHTLINTAHVVQQATGEGTLAGIDVPSNNNGNMLLTVLVRHFGGGRIL
mmetsp:Transcript_91026/g.152423  ORF Transcript_91026/g.152423 Transcript_91026/m.152423 type:complete len:332 (-) Transcript_91026:1036-2031(-)